MKVEILGTGCHDCLKLELLVGEILADLGRKGVAVSRVDDERAIRQYMPVDEIPGLVIDARLVSSAGLPNRETLREWLAEA